MQRFHPDKQKQFPAGTLLKRCPVNFQDAFLPGRKRAFAPHSTFTTAERAETPFSFMASI